MHLSIWIPRGYQATFADSDNVLRSHPGILTYFCWDVILINGGILRLWVQLGGDSDSEMSEKRGDSDSQTQIFVRIPPSAWGGDSYWLVH